MIKIVAFNRTIVELKRHLLPCNTNDASAFNRTIVELKPQSVRRHRYMPDPFNRTIVELKHNPQPSQQRRT